MAEGYKRKSSRCTFYIGMAVLISTIFVRNICGIPVPVILILGLASVVALFSDRDEIVALVVCCIPMSTAFQYKYMIVIAIMIYTIKFRNDIRITGRIVPLYLLMLWELMHGFAYDLSLYEYLRSFSELIFCAFLMSLPHKKFDYPLICRMLAITSISMMSIVLLNLFNRYDYLFTAIFSGSYRFSVGNEEAVNFGVNYNANGLGFICNLATLGLLQLILTKKHKLYDFFLIIILVLFGSMTLSRAYFVCLALLVLLYILAGAATSSTLMKRMLSIAWVIGVIFVLLYVFMPNVMKHIATRFQEEDLFNGRIFLFSFYHEHIFSEIKYTLFGIGLQDFEGKMIDIYGSIVNVCHNGLQEIVVCWGFPGLILFMWFLKEMVSWRSAVHRRFVNYLPLILLLVQVQAGQLVRNGIMLLSLSFVYISLCWSPEEEVDGISEKDSEIY